MSKEVEAAIKRIRNTIVYLGRKSGKTRYFEDINLIIEQAERVEELEKSLNTADVDLYNMFINYKKIKRQNKRYREALYRLDDFDVELGDSREDMQEKLSQIKFIKDEALERESE